VNSVYLGFGSGLVAEGCGFALQVRSAAMAPALIRAPFS
jgi:gamma-glutamyltranspeptidase